MNLWIFIGLVLLALEIFTTTFFLLFFGIAALVVAFLVFLFPLSMPVQIGIFSALSLLFFLFGKKVIKKKSSGLPDQDDLIGKNGIALESIDKAGSLRVVVGDTHWQAFSKSPIKKGSYVKIVSISNLTLEVEPL